MTVFIPKFRAFGIRHPGKPASYFLAAVTVDRAYIFLAIPIIAGKEICGNQILQRRGIIRMPLSINSSVGRQRPLAPSHGTGGISRHYFIIANIVQSHGITRIILAIIPADKLKHFLINGYRACEIRNTGIITGKIA